MKTFVNIFNELNNSETKKYKIKKKVIMESDGVKVERVKAPKLEEYYSLSDDEHIIWDSEVNYYDEDYMNDVKENQYQDYLDSLEDGEEPREFEDWYEDYINDSYYDESQYLVDDLEDNILPEIEKQLNDNVLLLSGGYNSNYADFRPSGAGGVMWNNGTKGFRDYIGGFDRVCITSTNGVLGAVCADHDGTVAGSFYTLPADKTELMKAMGYEEEGRKVFNEYDDYGNLHIADYDNVEEFLKDFMPKQFEEDLYYENLDVRDLNEHIDLLVPVKDTISSWGATNESEELKEVEGSDKTYTCIEDRQYGDFCVGVTMTAEEWGERASFWADSDEWENPDEPLLKNFETEEDCIAFIDDVWEITIVPSDDPRAVELLKTLDESEIKLREESKQIRKARKDSKEKGLVSEDTEEILDNRFDSRKSFYGKARVVKKDNGDEELYSYGTHVGGIRDGKPYSKGRFSQTTSRHQREFFKQRGLDLKDVPVEECDKSNKIEEAEVKNIQPVKNQGNIYMLKDEEKYIVGENYNEAEHIIENAEIYETKEEADKDYLGRCEITGGSEEVKDEVVEESDKIEVDKDGNKSIRDEKTGHLKRIQVSKKTQDKMADEYNKKLEEAEDIPDITGILEEYETEILTEEELGRDYYRTLCKTIDEVEKFNYHSDYWGYADDYQEENTNLMYQVEPYIGKEVKATQDGEEDIYKIIGLLIDNQYNSVGHSCILGEKINKQ